MALTAGNENKRITAVNESTESRDLWIAVAQAITNLDNIIASIDTATTAQVKSAIKTLAQHQKKIIKRLVQL